ncbi:MAG: hypothetical protein JSR32_07935 [Proteobacteria bacterium]|jgi:hypothetical protein|nr:hypothetical protein [Pseudomonadota bacterium]
MNPEEKARQLIDHINLNQIFLPTRLLVLRAYSEDDRSVARALDQAAAVADY